MNLGLVIALVLSCWLFEVSADCRASIKAKAGATAVQQGGLSGDLAGPRPLKNRELEELLTTTRGEQHVVVEFFVEWCPHCKKFGPVFRELAEHYSMSDDVRMVRINATRDTFTPEQFLITGYPTLLYFAKDREFSLDSQKIKTSRDYQSIKDWIDEKVREGRHDEEFRP